MPEASDDLFRSGPFFLQRLFPDETLYSWCARYHRLSGNRLARDTSLQLFGSATSGFWHDLPSNLEAFEHRTRRKLGSVDHLCRHHTQLSFYVPFRPEGLIAECIAAMGSKSVRDLKFRLGLPASRVGAIHPLKACRDCIASDVAAAGMAYWHQVHQFPSVWICPTHGCKLRQCTSRSKTQRRLQWVLPDMVAASSWSGFEVPPSPGEQFLRKLARISEEAFRSTTSPLVDRQTLRECCLAAAHRCGWLLDSGRVNLTAIRQQFLYQTAGLSHVPGFDFLEGVTAPHAGFLGSMLRAARSHLHPLKYLMLITFLFDSWDALMQSAAVLRPGSGPHCHVEADPRRIDLAQRVREQGQTVSEAARQVGLPFSRAMYWAKKDGLPYARRPVKIDTHLAQKISAGLISGLDCPSIANQSGATLYAVRRYRDTHPEVRARWNSARAVLQRNAYRRDFLLIVRAHAHANQTQLRKTPGSHFDWLRQHDQEWLADQLPTLWQEA